MEDVLRGDGLAADAAFRERHVLRDARVQMVAHHEHVEMLVEGVDGERPRRVGRRRQHVRLAAQFDDVRSVAAARALGVEGVDRPAREGAHGVLDEAGLVERVGVDENLDVGVVGGAEAAIDGGGGRPPVLVQFEAARARGDLLLQRGGLAGVALAVEAEIHREGFRRLQHARDVPRAGRACGGVGSRRRAGPAAEHGGDSARQRLLDELRADEVDVRIDAAGGQDQPLAGDGLRARPDDDVHAGLDVRVAGLADSGDAPAAQPDIRLDDPPMVEDERVGYDRIRGAAGAARLRLAHAVADDLAAAELDLLAVNRPVGLDLDDEFGVGEAHAVADRRAEHVGVRGASDGRGRGPGGSGGGRGGRVQRPHRRRVEADDAALAGERHEADLAGLARFETDGGPGGDVEAPAARGGAVEIERRVDLGEMVVAAHLHGAVAGVDDGQGDRAAAFVQRDLALGGEDFPRNHGPPPSGWGCGR